MCIRSLKGLNTFGRFSTILYKGDKCHDFRFAFPYSKRKEFAPLRIDTFSEGGVYSKRKEFAPKGSKFFPFTADPFSEGRQNNFDGVASPESLSIHLKFIFKVLEACANDVSDLSALCVKPPKLIHLGLGYNKICVTGDYLTGTYWYVLYLNYPEHPDIKLLSIHVLTQV